MLPILECGNDDIKFEYKQGFDLLNSFFSKDLPIHNVQCNNGKNNTVNIRDDTSSSITIEDDNFKLLNLINNQVKDKISISYSSADLAILADNKLVSPQNELELYYNKFKIGCELIDNYCTTVTLGHDSIAGLFNVHFPKSENKMNGYSHIDLNINESYLNSQMLFTADDDKIATKVVFNNCSFGPAASMFNMKVDTIVFMNCTDIPNPLFMTIDSSKNLVYLEMVNSNFNNIRFDYTDKFKLYFDKTVSEETKNNTYQSLFAKYKVEGKPQNIEKIDIEYKRYLYSKNLSKYPIWFLDYFWWRYGYSKWLIIVWTLVFLTLFFLYNFKHWEDMRKIYGVFDKDELSIDRLSNFNVVVAPSSKSETKKSKYKFLRRKSLFVLVYTSFIFFSLRVDFDKLKYANGKYVSWFFIQYVIGLISLFFLANAIFKIS